VPSSSLIASIGHIMLIRNPLRAYNAMRRPHTHDYIRKSRIVASAMDFLIQGVADNTMTLRKSSKRGTNGYGTQT
jgi:uncharacterized protein YcbK (DUF882 family)